MPRKTPAEQLAARKVRKPAKTQRNRPWTCKLAEKRFALGLTMREVGEAVDLTSAAVCEIEHGSDPMLTSAKRLADFFGMTIQEMWPNLK